MSLNSKLPFTAYSKSLYTASGLGMDLTSTSTASSMAFAAMAKRFRALFFPFSPSVPVLGFNLTGGVAVGAMLL